MQIRFSLETIEDKDLTSNVLNNGDEIICNDNILCSANMNDQHEIKDELISQTDEWFDSMLVDTEKVDKMMTKIITIRNAVQKTSKRKRRKQNQNHLSTM